MGGETCAWMQALPQIRSTGWVPCSWSCRQTRAVLPECWEASPCPQQEQDVHALERWAVFPPPPGLSFILQRWKASCPWNNNIPFFISGQAPLTPCLRWTLLDSSAKSSCTMFILGAWLPLAKRMSSRFTCVLVWVRISFLLKTNIACLPFCLPIIWWCKFGLYLSLYIVSKPAVSSSPKNLSKNLVSAASSPTH